MEYKSRNDVPSEFKWDLSKMYSNNDDIEKDIKSVNKLTDEILKYKGHILDNAESLLDFLSLTEKQDRLIEKLYVYSKMNHDVDTKDSKAKALKMKVEKISEDISEKYSFIEPEMLSSDYDTVLKYINEKSELKKYKFYLVFI